MLFRLIKDLMLAYGKYIERRHDTYHPQYKGHWKNRGGDHYEDWHWVEKADKNYIVNVFQLEDDFIITVGNRVRSNSIEHVRCRDEREVQIALDLLKSYYGELGNVITDKAIE